MMTEKDAPIDSRFKESETKLAEKIKVDNEARLKEAKAELEDRMNANLQAFIHNFMAIRAKQVCSYIL